MARVPATAHSLDQLEGSAWPPTPTGATPLVSRCHELRTVPIGRLTPGDIRVLLGQGIGTEYLMPLALELLTQVPLLEGDYYPGDLLSSAMSTEASYWSKHKPELKRLQAIAAPVRRELMGNEDSRRQYRQLLKDLQGFLGGSDA